MTKWDMVIDIFERIYLWRTELGYIPVRDDNSYRHITGFKLILFQQDIPRPENMLIFDFSVGKHKPWEKINKKELTSIYKQICV